MTRSPFSLRGPVMLGLAALAVLVLGFGLWAVTARLSGAVLAQGQVVALGRNVPVQHPDGGQIAAVLVAEGDPVAAGQVVLRLDGAALHSDLAIVTARLAEVAARIARLEGERDNLPNPAFPPALLAQAQTDPTLAALLQGQADLMAARLATEADLRAQLQKRKAQVQARLAGIAAQQAALEELSQLLAADLAQQEPLLAQGLIPQARVRGLHGERARLQGQAGELAASAAAAGDQLAELDIQLASLTAQRRETALTELRELWPLRLELEERQRALSDRIARLDLRAPVAGVVLGLQVTAPGAVLQAGAPALHLVPEGGLRVIARVSPLHIARIAPGQTADLAFPALEGGQAPRLSAQVTRVSADVLTDAQTGLGAYEVEIDLPAEAAALLSGQALQAGMPVEVYLQTGSRRAIAYLVEPFTRYFARALREG
jgi:HlyD family secretion protein